MDHWLEDSLDPKIRTLCAEFRQLKGDRVCENYRKRLQSLGHESPVAVPGNSDQERALYLAYGLECLYREDPTDWELEALREDVLLFVGLAPDGKPFARDDDIRRVVSPFKDTALLNLYGECHGRGDREAYDQVVAAAKEAADHIVFNLRHCASSLNSDGLDWFVKHASAIAEERGACGLLNVQPKVKVVLEMFKILDWLELGSNLAEIRKGLIARRLSR